MPETIIPLRGGWSLRTDAGDNVRLVEPDGTERLYWDQNEWHEDPVGVMAAIFGAATSIVTADDLSRMRAEMRAEGTEFSTCLACNAEIIRHTGGTWYHWFSGVAGSVDDPTGQDAMHRVLPADNADSVKLDGPEAEAQALVDEANARDYTSTDLLYSTSDSTADLRDRLRNLSPEATAEFMRIALRDETADDVDRPPVSDHFRDDEPPETP